MNESTVVLVLVCLFGKLIAYENYQQQYPTPKYNTPVPYQQSSQSQYQQSILQSQYVRGNVNPPQVIYDAINSGPPPVTPQYQYSNKVGQAQFQFASVQPNQQVSQIQIQSQRVPPQQVTNSHQKGPVAENRFQDSLYQGDQGSINQNSVNRNISQNDRIAYNQGMIYDVTSDRQQVTSVLNRISPSVERFALDFFTVVSRSPDANYMVSPYSIWSLLVLLYEGAGGRTRDEIQQRLEIPDMATLRSAFKIFGNILRKNTDAIKMETFQALVTDENRPVKRDYENLVEGLYNTDVIPVDFSQAKTAYDKINEYAAEKTNGNIQKVVTPADVLRAQMILLSGLHFEGKWKFPFNMTLTRVENFYDDNENVIGQVPMMFERAAFPYAAIADLECHVIELPYGQTNELSMILLLPRRGLTTREAIEKLKRVGLQKVMGELKRSADEFEDEEVEVFLPRFSTTTHFNLIEGLKIMGIRDLFDVNTANLENIVDNKSLYVSSLIQKTKIDVNEEGTVASAVTAAVLANKSTPPRIYANRPFAYLIVDKSTNVLLFCGQYTKP